MSSRRNAKKASKKERRLSKAIRRGATDDMLAAGVGSLNVTNVEEDAEAMERFLDKIPPKNNVKLWRGKRRMMRTRRWRRRT